MSDQFQIEKGIPIPEVNVKKSKYPFRQLEVGDSFVIDKSTQYTGALISQYNKKRLQINLIQRKIDDTHTRVWRVK